MSFDNIDRQCRRRDVGRGVAAATLGAAISAAFGKPAVADPPSGHQLFDERMFDIPKWGQLRAVAVGSRCTCNPPPTGTDQDWLVDYIGYRRCQKLFVALQAAGWVSCSNWHNNLNEEYPPGFEAFRLGDDNLIVPEHQEFYDKFRLSSKLAKKYNLLEKSDRVQLFQAVLYGADVEVG